MSLEAQNVLLRAEVKRLTEALRQSESRRSILARDFHERGEIIQRMQRMAEKPEDNNTAEWVAEGDLFIMYSPRGAYIGTWYAIDAMERYCKRLGWKLEQYKG